ncbi:MAG: dihydrodipicolinate synthase family protein [Actinomycetota bacterium]|nr:dihydrodipicolinate synthase family protein [Actinomycetota bacterium]
MLGGHIFGSPWGAVVTRGRPLHGVLPVFQTPFGDDEEVDYGELRAELEWVVAQGADGIVFGMVSELLRLSDWEREEVSRVACEVAAHCDLDAIISVGAESTRSAVRFARAAEDAGASGIMAIPPMATSLPDQAIGEYYRGILDATTLPLVVQDASGYVGRPLSIALQAELLSSYGGRVLFKPEAIPIGPRLSALRDATGGRARAFEGSGGVALIDSYRRGIVGTMPGADLCWAVVSLWTALEAGDFAGSYAIAGPLVGLVGLQASLDSFVRVEKYLLRKQQVLRSSRSRGPVSFQLDTETRDEIDRLFDQLGEIVKVVQADGRGRGRDRTPRFDDSESGGAGATR